MKTGKGITAAIIAAVITVIVLAAGIGYFAGRSKEAKALITEAEVEEAAEDLLDDIAENESSANMIKPGEWYGFYESSGDIERDIDLEGYKSRCPDVYAFIEIPGTDIEEPIAYCKDADDPFYFTHDIDGRPSDKGMIITDSMNSCDLSDPVTLIYGQDPEDGTMFSQLHLFRDSEFFEEHDKVNIYLADAELIYRIYACYIGSSDHILVNNDFSDPTAFGQYFDSIKNVRDLSMNIRNEAKPYYDDHVITLVTHCKDDSKRLFVHAVLWQVRWGK